MVKLDMVFPHGLAQDDALRRVKQYLNEIKMQFCDKITGLDEEWNNNKGNFDFCANGILLSVSATIEIMPNRVELSASLPITPIFLYGEIESTIQKHAEICLSTP